MKTPEQQFLHELETFRKEAEGGIQYWYTNLTIHLVATRNSEVHTEMNNYPRFWNTTLSALQTSSFITLGRIFDQESIHNIDRVIRIAQQNIQIFSKPALRARKLAGSTSASVWIDEYMRTVYEPNVDDFRRLRKHINKYRKIYEARYRDIRRKVYAHNATDSETEIQALFSKTNITEMQKLFIFLKRFHEALWQLFFNGQKPVLRSMRYSSHRMLEAPQQEYRPIAIQEQIVRDTQKLLTSLRTLNA
jgi:hypothetical protein